MKYYYRLRELREKNEYKQKAIADYLNITQQQYQLYESGKRALPIDMLKELCEFYNISADYILELTDEQKSFK